MKQLTRTDWHQLRCAQAAGLLESDPATGLAQAEVEARMRQFGPNRMTAHKRVSEWMRFALQFNQPLLYILIAATVITAALGEWVDAAVIFCVVLINAVIGYLQEAKAEKAIEALANMVEVRSCGLLRRSWCRAMWCCSNPAIECRPTCDCSNSATCTSRKRG